MQDRGYLSGLIIDETEQSAIQQRLSEPLRQLAPGLRIGRLHARIATTATSRSTGRFAVCIPNIVADDHRGIEQAGGVVEPGSATDLLTINGEFTASIVVVRCLTTLAGSLRWQIRFDAGLWPDITVAVRMDGHNHERPGLLPAAADRHDGAATSARGRQRVSLDAYRFDTLDAFFGLARASSLQEVA